MALYSRFTALLKEAGDCATAFQEAGVETPEPLRRMLQEESEEEESTSTQLPLMPPIRREDVPELAERNWISIKAEECSPTTVTLGVLRIQSEPIRPRDLNTLVIDILPDVTPGSIANIGTRLGDTVIERGANGWSLMNASMAPLMHDGYLWGPPTLFSKQDLAAHRREALLYVLGHFPTGLQVVQILDQLKRLGWLKAPVNKDLVKEDMLALANEGKVRRRGNSAKWELRKEA